MDEDDTLLGDKVRFLERRAGVFGTFLTTTSTRRLSMTRPLFPPPPLAPPLGDEPIMDDMTVAIRGKTNFEAAGSDFLPVGSLKLTHPESFGYFHNLLVNVWRSRDGPQ